MSNSKLVTYTKISPNKTSPRNKPIDTIAIHCVAGNCSLETIGNIFGKADPQKGSSSNYAIDSNGNVGMYVEETDRSWCTSSSSVDNRAVTIEVANDGGAPEYHVSDKAMAKLIELVADICKRNDIKKLRWANNKNLMGQVDKQNMVLHKWTSNKACPGPYLIGKHYYIAEEVNKILDGAIDNNANTNSNVNENDAVKQDDLTYNVTIGVNALNVRKGPGTEYPVVKTLRNDKNIYTIISEAESSDGKIWCELKSGIGWLCKDFVNLK